MTGYRPAARIQDAFEREAAKRPRNLDKEMLAVWRATNEERKQLNKGPIPLSDVEAASRLAEGHVDYSMKLALYCEQLVLG